MAQQKNKSARELARAMYRYFGGYSGDGVPSYGKFARECGMTLEELAERRCDETFDRAWRECGEIRSDYLIDSALTKRADPSFVKYLLSEESTDSGADDEIKVTLEVSDGE